MLRERELALQPLKTAQEDILRTDYGRGCKHTSAWGGQIWLGG